jgi:hypothetical protein
MIFEFMLSRYSSSPLPFGHNEDFLYNLAIYVANLSIFTKTSLCEVWVRFNLTKYLF